MKIVIDCFKQVKGVGKSVGIYNLTVCLVINLAKSQKTSKEEYIRETELVVLGNKYNRQDFAIPGVKFVEIKRWDPLNKIHCVLWELFEVALICKKIKADRVMFPRGYDALIHPVKDIVTINDLIPYYYAKHFPDTFNRIENTYIMMRLKAAAKHSHHIITLSEASKEDIVNTFKINAKKISVINCGLTDTPHRIYDVEKPYICAGTSRLPHKNAVGILKAYERYFEKTKEPLPIVITGISDTSCYHLPENIRKMITCIDFIKDDNEFYSYTANSKLFLYLSLIEGFGFPPIEAMQMGVPVICSNSTSIPEAVGDSAVLVDPDDPEQVADAMIRILQDEDLQRELVIKGQENIKRFTWEKIAKLYWKVFFK